MKKAFILFLFCFGMTAIMYSQTQNEFVLEKLSSTSNTIQSACKEDGHRLATIEFFTSIENVEFETVSNNRIVSIKYDKKNGCYVLCLRGVDDEWRHIQIDIRKAGYRTYQMEAIQIKNGEYLAYKLSPKIPPVNHARITVYGKDNEILVGAEVKNKTGDWVYGTTDTDGTIAINIDRKGQTKNVIVSHPSYSDTKEITIQSGIHYTVYLNNYSPIQKANVTWYIVPGLGETELGRKSEGSAFIVGEVLLLGGGVFSSVLAHKQLEIMRDVDVSLEDFMTAKNKYNTLKTVNVACYVGAGVLYGFHLYRVYHLSKKAKSKGYALAPTIITTDESMALGLSLNIKF